MRALLDVSIHVLLSLPGTRFQLEEWSLAYVCTPPSRSDPSRALQQLSYREFVGGA